MCGIAGIIGFDQEQQVRMSRMLNAQKHRGPDSTGFFNLGEHGILGHNRLAIISLGEDSNQPFASEDGRFVMVFNGEIYNYLELREELKPYHCFKTQSDTEVLLAAFRQWGTNCVHKLNGMFAFAIWDTQTHKLFAARDRFGVKPFHYSQHKNKFLFASEIKTLWAAGIPRIPKQQVWAGYFAYGSYGMPDETFWEDVNQLPAGHFLILQNGKLQIKQWYNFVENIKQAGTPTNEKAIREQWLALALDSIKLRFRADVEIGFNVSGGLDSSLLLGLVKHLFGENNAIKAFSFFTGDIRYDELPWVRELIAHTNFPLNEVKLTADEVPALARTVGEYQDEPYGGIPTLAYSKIFQSARRQNVVVLLDGQGMDEAWAGYDYYLQQTNYLVQGTTTPPVRPECIQAEFLGMANIPVYPTPFDNRLQNLQYRDLFYTKIPRALRFNERVSMMHSTELREPFLDYRMVEMAFALPYNWKIKDGNQKWLARQIAADYLHKNLRLAPKRPLQTPQREWLSQELRPWVSELLHESDSLFSDWLIPAKVQAELKVFFTEKSDNSFFIWQWINGAMALKGNPSFQMTSIL